MLKQKRKSRNFAIFICQEPILGQKKLIINEIPYWRVFFEVIGRVCKFSKKESFFRQPRFFYQKIFNQRAGNAQMQGKTFLFFITEHLKLAYGSPILKLQKVLNHWIVDSVIIKFHNSNSDELTHLFNGEVGERCPHTEYRTAQEHGRSWPDKPTANNCYFSILYFCKRQKTLLNMKTNVAMIYLFVALYCIWWTCNCKHGTTLCTEYAYSCYCFW